eukprot:1172682-Prorocentrum_minimum.AAC.3
MATFKWLAQGAEAGDSLFVHYSGHGGKCPSNPANGGPRGAQKGSRSGQKQAKVGGMATFKWAQATLPNSRIFLSLTQTEPAGAERKLAMRGWGAQAK